LPSQARAKYSFALDKFEQGGVLDNYHIACFHKRNGQMNAYGVDSWAKDYSYFHQQLLDWIVNKMNDQPDEGPMNHIIPLIGAAGYPAQTVISIGATRYTEFGETHFLQPGDTSIVVVYSGEKYQPEQIAKMARTEQFPDDISSLVQKII